VDIFKKINESSDYIEANIRNLDMTNIYSVFGYNERICKSIFLLMNSVSLGEYIKSRKLSLAARDILNGKKINEIALDYGYSSSPSFIKAFKQFHGFNPTEIKQNKNFKYYPIIKFAERETENTNKEITIIKLEDIILYGDFIEVDVHNIPPLAEKLWSEMNALPEFKNATKRYGIITNINGKVQYWATVETPFEKSKKLEIKAREFISINFIKNDSKEIDKQMSEIEHLFGLDRFPCIEIYSDSSVQILV